MDDKIPLGVKIEFEAWLDEYMKQWTDQVKEHVTSSEERDRRMDRLVWPEKH